MVHVHQSLTLDASANDVWEIVGNFDKMSDWHPAILTTESEDTENGRQRALTLLGGTKKQLERLNEFDGENLSYTYSMIDGPLPVQDYTGKILVESNEEAGCTVTWSADFEPQGTTEADASAVIEGYFSTGMNALKKQFAPKT